MGSLGNCLIILSAVGLLALQSCITPRIITQTDPKGAEVAVTDTQGVFVFLKEFTAMAPQFQLGTIKVNHTGFNSPCSYEDVRSLAKEEATKMGGNVFLETMHKNPKDFLNPCHRISGTVYRVPNPSDYETEILWSEDRKLTITDFKGSKENRPFAAATAAYYEYKTSYQPKSNSFTVYVNTVFSCTDSYFNQDPEAKKNQFYLAHEQLHFDIVEVYARKFVKRIQNEIKNFKDYKGSIAQMGDEVASELRQEQDAYDAEVYSDLSRQDYWNAKVAKSLKELAAFKEKRFTKPFK